MMEFLLEVVPQKIEKLEYMTAKEILYGILNTSYIFYLAAGLVVRAKNFKVVHYQMRRKIIVIFADLY